MEIEGQVFQKNQTTISLSDQLASDIELFCQKFSNENYAIRLLAKRAEVSEKTVKRLREKQNRPSAPTLFRLYLVFTDAKSEKEFLERCPIIIKKELESKKISFQLEELISDFDFFGAIEKQPLVGEIYILASLGEIHKNEVLLKYGQFGMDIIEMLVKNNLLIQMSKHVFTASTTQPIIDGKVIKSLGLHLINRYSKPENAKLRGENSLGFYAEKLNHEGLQKWLSIDEEAFYKKVELTKQSEFQGDIPVFTVGITDTLESSSWGGE